MWKIATGRLEIGNLIDKRSNVTVQREKLILLLLQKFFFQLFTGFSSSASVVRSMPFDQEFIILIPRLPNGLFSESLSVKILMTLISSILAAWPVQLNLILYYKIWREKFEPEPGFEPRTSGFLLRFYNVNFPRHKLWVCFQLVT